MRVVTYEDVVEASDAFAGSLTDGVECQRRDLGETRIYVFMRHGSEIGRIALRRLAMWSVAAAPEVFVPTAKQRGDPENAGRFERLTQNYREQVDFYLGRGPWAIAWRDAEAGAASGAETAPEPTRARQGGPTAKTQYRAQVMSRIVGEHPGWTMPQVALAASEELKEPHITSDTVRNTWRAMGWDWGVRQTTAKTAN